MAILKNYPLPTMEAFTKLLADLLGKKVASTVIPPLTLTKDTQITATFLNEKQEIVSIAACDLKLGASAAAVLTMVPAGMAKEAVKAGALSDNLMENLQEIFNISSTLLNAEGAPRVVLGTVIPASAPMPPEVTEMITKPAARLDLEIEVPGYDKGKWVFMSKAIN